MFSLTPMLTFIAVCILVLGDYPIRAYETLENLAIARDGTLNILESSNYIDCSTTSEFSREEADVIYQAWLNKQVSESKGISISQYIEYTGSTERKLAFLANLNTVKQHNCNQDNTYELGLTAYAHLTFEEFSSTRTPINKNNGVNDDGEVMCSQNLAYAEIPTSILPSTPDIPTLVDWRQQAQSFTEVKMESINESSWAHASAAIIETYYALNGGVLTKLSVQQLLDCIKQSQIDDDVIHDMNDVCLSPIDAFHYLSSAKINGLASEAVYPQASSIGECTTVNVSQNYHNERLDYTFAEVVGGGEEGEADVDKPVLTVTRVQVPKYIKLKSDEKEMTYIVATNGPVTAIMSMHEDFHLYTKGVYSPTKCNKKLSGVRHSVVLIGYQEAVDEGESSGGYWIGRNSWGDNWGQDGYFLLHKNVNMCGIKHCAAYPMVPVNL